MERLKNGKRKRNTVIETKKGRRRKNEINRWHLSPLERQRIDTYNQYMQKAAKIPNMVREVLNIPDLPKPPPERPLNY